MIRSIYNYDVMWKHLQFLLAVKSQILLILLGSVSCIKNGNTLFHLVMRKNTNSVPFFPSRFTEPPPHLQRILFQDCDYRLLAVEGANSKGFPLPVGNRTRTGRIESSSFDRRVSFCQTENIIIRKTKNALI